MPLNDAVKKFLASPPAGSRTRAALDYGVDISVTARNLDMTIDERVADLGEKMDWLRTLRRARRI